MNGIWDYIAIVGVLMELAAGVVLALFAAKSLKSGFLGSLSKKRLLIYFVLLWGVRSSSGLYMTYLPLDPMLWNTQRTLWDLSRRCLIW